MMAEQILPTGGVWLSWNGLNFCFDPGPGALVRMKENRLSPSKLRGVFVSHIHLDHTGDLFAVLDAITEGAKKKRGFLVAPEEVIKWVPDYLINSLEEVVNISRLETGCVDGVKFYISPPHQHHGVETYGYIFEFEKVKAGFWVDGKFDQELLSFYSQSDVLVLNVVLWDRRPIDHLCLEDAMRIVEQSRAELFILTHFGMSYLRNGIKRASQLISERTGKRVVSSYYGMAVVLPSLEVRSWSSILRSSTQ